MARTLRLIGLISLVAACGSAGPSSQPSQSAPVVVASATASALSATATPVASPTASALSATATPVASVDTTGWLPFTSTFYGFSISHPVGWTEAPASGHWSLAEPADESEDTLTSPSGPPSPVGRPNLAAWEVKVPSDMTADALIAAYTNLAHGLNDCYPLGTKLPQTMIDGHPATIAYGGCGEQYYYAEAITVVDNRVWIFLLHGPDRSLIVPFLSTVKIDPTKVVD